MEIKIDCTESLEFTQLSPLAGVFINLNRIGLTAGAELVGLAVCLGMIAHEITCRLPWGEKGKFISEFFKDLRGASAKSLERKGKLYLKKARQVQSIISLEELLKWEIGEELSRDQREIFRKVGHLYPAELQKAYRRYGIMPQKKKVQEKKMKSSAGIKKSAGKKEPYRGVKDISLIDFDSLTLPEHGIALLHEIRNFREEHQAFLNGLTIGDDIYCMLITALFEGKIDFDTGPFQVDKVIEMSAFRKTW
jgi:hypothetical protein